MPLFFNPTDQRFYNEYIKDATDEKFDKLLKYLIKSRGEWNPNKPDREFVKEVANHHSSKSALWLAENLLHRFSGNSDDELDLFHSKYRLSFIIPDTVPRKGREKRIIKREDEIHYIELLLPDIDYSNLPGKSRHGYATEIINEYHNLDNNFFLNIINNNEKISAAFERLDKPEDKKLVYKWEFNRKKSPFMTYNSWFIFKHQKVISKKYPLDAEEEIKCNNYDVWVFEYLSKVKKRSDDYFFLFSDVLKNAYDGKFPKIDK